MKKISLLLVLMCSSALRAMDDGSTNDKTVLTVELDGVVSNQEEVGLTDFASMAPSLGFLNSLRLLKNASQLTDEYHKIASKTHGMGNVYYELAAKIGENYNVDLTKYTSDLVKRSTKLTPNQDVIDFLIKIRERGDVVMMSVTDMDYEHFGKYRDEMDDHQVDLNDLFGGTVVTRFNYLEVERQEEVLWTEVEKEVYMVNSNSVKPTDDYFKVAGEIVTHYHPDAHQLVHVDTTQKSVAAAVRNGFKKSIFFPGSADNLKKSLQFYGLSID